jgi:hypothetical protein
MTTIQFRVLYREFLFRLVDLEILSAQGDISKLLGQFGAVLIFLSFALSRSALFLDPNMPPARLLSIQWDRGHALIALTMVTVGLFAVLSWDSAFPDRRDVLVLAPLPIRARTLFLAKIAALATALSVTVLALNVLTGLAWPMVFAPMKSGFPGVIRSLAAFWTTVSAAGAFMLCSILGLHGLAAQLPRQKFLRLSGLLQVIAFGLLLGVYLLSPGPGTPTKLAAPDFQRALEWIPSYWFFGLFHVLNGSVPEEIRTTIDTLAFRAVAGLAIASIGAGTAFLLSYFRTLRKIVEEPDILPGARSRNWLPRCGDSLSTAIVHFSIRTLLRSRQHRVILAVYLGLGFALVVISLQAPPSSQPQALALSASYQVIGASALMMLCSIAGTRVVFPMPIQLRANWIFRVTPVPGPRESLTAIRRSFLMLSVAPVWAISAVVLLSIGPLWIAASHLIVLALAGAILTDVVLIGFPKIPFTCSYQPGKSRSGVAFAVFGGFLAILALVEGLQLEKSALEKPARYALMIVILCVAAAWARWLTVSRASSREGDLLFEEKEAPAIYALDLHRDGRFQA